MVILVYGFSWSILRLFICLCWCYVNGFQEVAVKKFLDQDLSGDALAQVKCEVSRRRLTLNHVVLSYNEPNI